MSLTKRYLETQPEFYYQPTEADLYDQAASDHAYRLELAERKLRLIDFLLERDYIFSQATLFEWACRNDPSNPLALREERERAEWIGLTDYLWCLDTPDGRAK